MLFREQKQAKVTYSVSSQSLEIATGRGPEGDLQGAENALYLDLGGSYKVVYTCKNLSCYILKIKIP